jgi:hypothetical protein
MKNPSAVGRVQASGQLPRQLLYFFQRQAAHCLDILFQRHPLKIVHNEVGPRLLRVGPSTVTEPDNRQMLQALQRQGFFNHGIEIAVENVGTQSLHDNTNLGKPIPAQEGNAESARSQDSLRGVVFEGKRSKSLLVKPSGFHQFLQRHRPTPLLNGSKIRTVMSRGFRCLIADQSGHLPEILLGRFKIARRQFQLADGAQEGREFPTLFLWQTPELRLDRLDKFSLGFTPNRLSITGGNIPLMKSV